MSQYNSQEYKRPSTANSDRQQFGRQFQLQKESNNFQLDKEMHRPSSTKAFLTRNNRYNVHTLLKDDPKQTEQKQQQQQQYQKTLPRTNSAKYIMPRPYTSNESSFIKQEMQLCYARNKLTETMDKNQAYFQHLQGKCLCALCTCGHCKCEFGFLKDKSSMVNKPLLNMRSQYQQQFQKYPDKVKNIAFNQSQAHPSIKLFSPDSLDRDNYNSIYVTSYQKPDGEKTNLICPRSKSTYGMDPQFIQKTQYQVKIFNLPNKNQNAYKNWKDAPSEFQKPANPRTLINQPFKGESIYKHVYKQYSTPRDQDDQKILERSRQPLFKSPINPSFNMNYSTQAQDSFYPKNNNYGNYQPNQLNLPASLPLLCRTTYQQDFGKKNNICPAKQLLYQLKSSHKK